MATLPTFFKTIPGVQSQPRERDRRAAVSRPVRLEADPYLLRTLPNEDVFFFSKRIDNSRVAREADPRARRQCWRAIGAACVFAALLTSVLAPGVLRILAGYQVQALKQEHQRLLDERSMLEVEEARLLSPARLEELARRQKLGAPARDQIIHLEPRHDGSLALNLKSR